MTLTIPNEWTKQYVRQGHANSMGNIFSDDFRDFFQSLNDYEVKYILVGGFSVFLHGYSRTTGDMG